MRKRRQLSIAFYACLILTMAGTIFFGLIGRNTDKLVAKETSDGGASDAASSAYKLAAAQNAKLQKELEWAFGGRPQRGWYIYLPLIDELIGSTKDPDTAPFAAAVTRWQKSVGVAPTGIINDDTLLRMITVWQSRRTYDHAVPSTERLITAPPSDYFAPSRPEELRKVERATYASYKRMVAAAIRDSSLGLGATKDGQLAASEKFLKLISTFRSPKYQDELRRRSPNAGTAGLAKNSPHFTGRALDLYVGGDPVSTVDQNRAFQTQTIVYKWLVKNAATFGFYPYFYEPWHWEYKPL